MSMIMGISVFVIAVSLFGSVFAEMGSETEPSV